MATLSICQYDFQNWVTNEWRSETIKGARWQCSLSEKAIWMQLQKGLHTCVWVCDAKHQSTRCCNRNCGKRQSFHCSLRSLWNSFFPPSFLCSAAVCCCCRLKRIRANNLKYFLIWSNGVETVATVSRCRRRWCWQNRNIITNGVTVKFVPPPMSWTQIRKIKKKKKQPCRMKIEKIIFARITWNVGARQTKRRGKETILYLYSFIAFASVSLSLSISFPMWVSWAGGDNKIISQTFNCTIYYEWKLVARCSFDFCIRCFSFAICIWPAVRWSWLTRANKYI